MPGHGWRLSSGNNGTKIDPTHLWPSQMLWINENPPARRGGFGRGVQELQV